VISVYDNTAISNATLKLYCSNLVVKAGGTVTLPSGSVDAAGLTGNILVARMTNAITATGVRLTNDVLVAGGGTNRCIYEAFGNKYLLISITGL